MSEEESAPREFLLPTRGPDGSVRMVGLDGSSMQSLLAPADAHVHRHRYRRKPVKRLLAYGRDAGGGPRVAFDAYGVRIALQVTDAELLEDVIDALPPDWTPADPNGADCFWRIDRHESESKSDGETRVDCYRDGDLIHEALELNRAADVLESQLHLYIAEFATPWLFVHAGVVRWRDAAIVLPGRSFAGKSTLVAALVAAGASYYSDEYAVLDVAGRVVPFGRRLSIREGPLGPKGRIDLAHRGPSPEDAKRPLRIGLVAVLTYEPESDWQIEEVGPANGILALCKHTVAIRRRPVDAFAILGNVTDAARVIQGKRGEADNAAASLLRLAVEGGP